MVLGMHKLHQDGGFSGADLRFLLTDGNSFEGKKMTFQNRITGKCFQFFVPAGTVVMFSKTGAGVTPKSAWFHGVIDAGGCATILGEMMMFKS
mmetsp:Transcript_13281/g.28805  ORF Transcript_13281/g.28805 Transcript_13281/m.28805 type:complete len:93 (-) Transcript_13281:1408-1686(-)